MNSRFLHFDLIKGLMPEQAQYFFCQSCLKIYEDCACTVPLVDLNDFVAEQRLYFFKTYVFDHINCKNCKPN